MKSVLYLTLFNLFLIADFASAQSRCDCREIVGGCTASVRAEGKLITLVSTSQACSRIDYYINGEPQLNVVMDGRDQEEWLGPSRIESIDVQGCVVCKDTHFGPGSESGSGEPGNFRVDSLDQQLLGVWNLIPRTIQMPKETFYQSGPLNVTEKLSPGRYRISVTSVERVVRKPGGEITNHTRRSNGTLTVSGSRVTINYDDPDWSPENLTLNGNSLRGSDAGGSIEYAKQ